MEDPLRLRDPMIVVYGSTASGKSEIAEKLAGSLGGEIVNCDAAQLYSGVSVGVATPDLNRVTVPHHLFACQDSPENINVRFYREMAERVFKEIISRGRLPIFVGGSGFYVKSLFFPPVKTSPKQLNVLLKVPGVAGLSIEEGLDARTGWEYLKKVDPKRASEIHPNDTYRIQRALSLFRATGIKPSELKPYADPIAEIAIFIYISRDPTDLRDRIERRVRAMLDAGWEEEVRSIIGTPWEAFVLARDFIGYRQLIAAAKEKRQLRGFAREEIIAEITKETMDYAKYQVKLWRNLRATLVKLKGMVFVHEINLTGVDQDLYICDLQAEIENLLRAEGWL